MLLEHILEKPSDSPNIIFRSCLYGTGDREQLIRDVIALANTDCKEDCYIVFGVATESDGRKMIGVEKSDLGLLRQQKRMAARAIEPELELAPMSADVEGKLFAALKIDERADPPYLVKEYFSNDLRNGECWIKDGSDVRLAHRQDLDRIYARKGASRSAVLQIGLNGNIDCETLAIEVPDLPARPIVTNGSSDELKHTDTANDETQLYDFFDKSGVMINLILVNNQKMPLQGTVIEITLPRTPDFDVADRINSAPNADNSRVEAKSEEYPEVRKTENAIFVRSALGDIEPRQPMEVFERPLWLAVSETMKGKKIGIRYVVVARNLPEAIRGRVKLKFSR